MKLDIPKILAMSEEEQQIWLIKNEVMVGAVLQCKGGGELPCPSESLADLAFRLRDEAVEKDCMAYKNALEEVRKAWLITAGSNGTYYLDRFVMYDAKPIHWVIAALIARDEPCSECNDSGEVPKPMPKEPHPCNYVNIRNSEKTIPCPKCRPKEPKPEQDEEFCSIIQGSCKLLKDKADCIKQLKKENKLLVKCYNQRAIIDDDEIKQQTEQITELQVENANLRVESRV